MSLIYSKIKHAEKKEKKKIQNEEKSKSMKTEPALFWSNT